RPNGYDLFEQAAISSGGAGAIYDASSDGDNQVDPNPLGGDCANQGYYVDFCYKLDEASEGDQALNFTYPIGRLVFVDLAGDGTTPPAGPVVRFSTTPKGQLLLAGDQFRFNTADLTLVTGDDATAQEALEAIGIVPNPYFGRSLYETGTLDRRVRFTNLPPQVTIRIYTVAGSLIRELTKDGPSRSLDWNLETFNDLPVASGMYLI